MRTIAAVAFLVGMATPMLAHANETTEPNSASEGARWYGWQIAISDAAALALAIGGSSADSDALFYPGVGVFLIVPPVIHGLHDRSGAVAGSLALRAGLPAVVALGSQPDGDSDGDSAEDESKVKRNVIAAMLFVSAVDIVFSSTKSPPARATARLDPVAWFDRDRAAVGAVGRF